MGGGQRGSSSQQKAASQPSTSALSSSARTDATQQLHLPSSFATLALDQTCSPDLLSDGEREESCPAQQELEPHQSRVDRTAGDGPLDTLSDENTNGCSSPPPQPQAETSRMGKLSLFSGMELVTKGASPCVRETEGIEDSSTEVTAANKMKNINGNPVNTTVYTAVLSTSSQPVSAFSFVNFWQELELIQQLWSIACENRSHCRVTRTLHPSVMMSWFPLEHLAVTENWL